MTKVLKKISDGLIRYKIHVSVVILLIIAVIILGFYQQFGMAVPAGRYYSPTASPTSSPRPSPTSSPTTSPTVSPTSSPTSSPSPTVSPSPSPTPSGCCMFEDRCEDMEDISECPGEGGINWWVGRSCSDITGCRTGCCFYHNLEEGNAGTCSQKTATGCALLSGSFYENTSCDEVEECDDRYGCCIWVDAEVLYSTTMEKDECLAKSGAVFLEGQRCPERACLDDSYCLNDGERFCHPFEGSIYRETCNTAIHSCVQTLVEECEYGCSISTAECIPAPSPSPSPSPTPTGTISPSPTPSPSPSPSPSPKPSPTPKSLVEQIAGLFKSIFSLFFG